MLVAEAMAQNFKTIVNS